MTAYPLQGPICANQTYPLTVKISKHNDVRQGDKFIPYVSTGEDAIPIEASVRDDGIATLMPRRQITGWGLEHDVRGEAQFYLQTLKEGRTDLFFEATIAGKYHEEKLSIKVVPCSYKVTLTYSMQQSSHGTFGLLNASMQALLERDGQTYKGSGILHNSRTELMPPCTFSSPGFENPTTITGKRTGSGDAAQLELTIDYEPGESTASISCPGIGTKNPSNTEDPSNWLAETGAFPDNGGTRVFPINYSQWFGSLIITVAPVDASSR